MAATRIAGSLLAVTAVAAVLAGCSGIPAPPGPTAAQLRVLVSRAEGVGSDGYTDYGVNLVRFISARAWPSVMTACIRRRGITTVDFLELPPGPYSYPSDPQGGAALEKALIPCGLEYPVDTMKTLRTTAQWSYQYAYLESDFAACVRTVGARLSGLPGRARYLATARASSAMPSPYSYVSGDSGAARAVLRSKCSATAPGL